MAIAYLGSCSGAASPSFSRYKDHIFTCLSKAFVTEKAAGLRRTAGDALSDFNDERAVMVAADQLLRDGSKLVRWRAARILGELAGRSNVPPDESTTGNSVSTASSAANSALNIAVKALQEAVLVEGQSFEVIFECTNSLSTLQNGDLKAVIPVWQQIAGVSDKKT
jgi:HEAT repeat protein